jgi:hypothetical protein
MDQAELQRTLAAARQARKAGRGDEAAELLNDVIARAGEQPAALNSLGLNALAERRHGDSAALFRRAIAADPHSPELWMNLARALREADDIAGEREALEGALAIDQRHFMALVRLAELFERTGDEARAAERWSGVLALAAMMDERPPALEGMVEHAGEVVARRRAGFAAVVDAGLAEVRQGLEFAERQRFDACIDHALGRRRIYANQPAGLHFPFLPADEFFERRHFPWLERIESQTDVIRTELEALLARDEAVLRPYVAMEPGTPANKWSPLDNKLDWGALHLWKDGRRDDSVCALVPQTAAAVEALPLSDLPGRTPTVFFSLLQPGTHLPAHTGVSNVRAIIHLPLIVPPGCAFRVGGETRQWEVGRAWAFDDTIEHEACNPYIHAVVRDLLRRFYAVAAETDSGAGAEIGISD